MAVISGPDIDASGLILSIDAANYKSYNPNINLWGQTFDNGYWNVNSATFLSTTEIAPDGTATATTIQDSSTSSYQNISRSFTISSATVDTYSLSLYVKKTSGGTAAGFAVNTSLTGGTTSVNSNQRLNTDSGVVTGASVISDGDYWRMYWTITNNTSGNNLLGMTVYPAARVPGGVTDTTTATGTATIWGVLVTQGSTLLDYRPNFGTGATVLYDVSGNSNNFTFTNTVTFANNALQFDGIASKGQLAANTVYGNNTTWEAWVNRTASISTFNIFMGRYLPYFSLFSNNSIRFSNVIGGVQRTLISNGTPIQDNNWYHLAFTTNYDGSTNTTMTIYLNGNLNNSAAYTGTQGTYTFPFTIGMWYPSGTDNPFYGKIANIKVYDRTLSADEIRQNFEATRGRFGI